MVEETGNISYNFTSEEDGERKGWTRYSYACLLSYEDELDSLNAKSLDHKKYSREGMIKRVLDERRQKAEKAGYSIKRAKNIYGDHILINDAGSRHKFFLRDFENETGYSDSIDAKFNKLGTPKHIMYVFSKLKGDGQRYEKLDIHRKRPRYGKSKNRNRQGDRGNCNEIQVRKLAGKWKYGNAVSI
jgi:hypothetical protein